MKIDDLIKIRKLRKIPIDKEKVFSSVRTAEQKLSEAKKLCSKDFYNQTLLTAYTAMFHSARAILYHDGVQEKSHYAVYIYLSEKYSKKIPLSVINSFYNYQKERHGILYGMEEQTNKEEAGVSIVKAEEMIKVIKELLEGDHGKL